MLFPFRIIMVQQQDHSYTFAAQAKQVSMKEGFSVHNNWPLLNTAIRSGGGTKSALPSLLIHSTKSMMTLFGAVSFQVVSMNNILDY